MMIFSTHTTIIYIRWLKPLTILKRLDLVCLKDSNIQIIQLYMLKFQMLLDIGFCIAKYQLSNDKFKTSIPANMRSAP